ncbi:CBASS cGAMP-activated phospholipase [Chitinophaga ginsengisegetis]|uniref:CBASS cGAMP-activated phospholipase n=1 Tax=Chitinophaga ginsengisegetis TaxID=393003 RepID=UPI000DC0462A|nr:CBASS cGAMP-activated phospholipase [Chitinophaga ginsengisegetis]MDR6571350.1 patatin-like phospholipase/acyl hydrolase [Chitinophaga ginsengisegetis]MDR6651081.1 patatin-like phospholipase/acyl hydrolase [Chitinophaga ginsengisegetis]MDR6657431.1 patatin-like phospholipase/acyl hydrolase [Chitinophaga ginsengisegetis]
MTEKKKKFTILSIDGGGIRGLIPAKVLSDLERELKRTDPDKKFHEHFNLICGTSTGAILAIAISLGIPASDLVEFYRENAKAIFPKWYLRVIPRKSRAIITSIYSNKSLRKKLEEVFAAANNGIPPLINDLKTNICIPVFNGNDGQINVLKTKHHEGYSRDYKLPAHEVALSSASAPVYFPPHTFRFSNEHGSGINVNMIDGGIFANNPSLIGILEATEKLGYEFSDIRLLSLGTGKGRHVIKTGWKPKDIWYWLFPKPRLLDIILDSQAQITEQYIAFIKRIAARQNNDFDYLRVQYDLGGDTIDLNASERKDLQRLEAIGDELSKNYVHKIITLLKN